MKTFKLALVWLFLLGGLTVYSYSQIDLNLTLSSFGPYQSLQQALIKLGYHHRPLSTLIFAILLVGLSLVSYLLIGQVRQGLWSVRHLWLLIGASLLVVIPSYPAFSHDFFNYLFSSKLVTWYHLNPYQVRALDLPQDHWTRFMHWTHRPNVYPPVWVLLSLPTTFLGMGKFTASFLLMKLLLAVSFLLAAKMIAALGGRSALALWAFNPLVIIEGLVSGHNDLVMMALMLISIWYLVNRRRLWGLIFGLLAIGTKFTGGAAALPFLVDRWSFRVKTILALALLAGLMVLVSWRLGFQPWYLLWPVTLAVFLPEKKFLTWVLSILALATYLPFLYRGDWGGSAEFLRNSFMIVFLLLAPVWFLKSFVGAGDKVGPGDAD